MTTTVTIETHDWPAAVETVNDHAYSRPHAYGHNSSRHTEFVPAHTKRQYSLSDTCSLNFRELPKDATSLEYGQPTPACANQPNSAAPSAAADEPKVIPAELDSEDGA